MSAALTKNARDSRAVARRSNRAKAANLQESEAAGEVLTGVLYLNTHKPTFLELLNLVEEPVATLPESRVRPSREALDELMEELR